MNDTDNFYAAALRRIEYLTVGIGILATVAVAIHWGIGAGSGLAIGAALSWINFRWMKQGVTTLALLSVAQEHATLAINKRTRQRSQITLETELEGLNVLPGDRIGVQSGMVKWAQSARVASWDGGLVVNLDKALDWTVGTSFAVLLRDPTGVPVRVVGVTRGATDDQMILPAAPPFSLIELYDTLEATQLSFGAVDQEITDWTITKMTPNGNTVTLDAVNYDPTIYAGAADFTRAPFVPFDADDFLTEEGAT